MVQTLGSAFWRTSVLKDLQLFCGQTMVQKRPSDGSSHTFKLAGARTTGSLPSLSGEMLSTTFRLVCGEENYVAPVVEPSNFHSELNDKRHIILRVHRSESAEEGHEFRVFFPVLLALPHRKLTAGQRLGLGFHVNPGVAVRRIHGNMAKPVANNVDVHAGLQEVSR